MIIGIVGNNNGLLTHKYCHFLDNEINKRQLDKEAKLNYCILIVEKKLRSSLFNQLLSATKTLVSAGSEFIVSSCFEYHPLLKDIANKINVPFIDVQSACTHQYRLCTMEYRRMLRSNHSSNRKRESKTFDSEPLTPSNIMFTSDNFFEYIKNIFHTKFKFNNTCSLSDNDLQRTHKEKTNTKEHTHYSSKDILSLREHRFIYDLFLQNTSDSVIHYIYLSYTRDYFLPKFTFKNAMH